MNQDLKRFLDGEIARMPGFARDLDAQIQEHLRAAVDTLPTAMERQHRADALRALREHGPHFQSRFVEEMQERVHGSEPGASGLAKFKPSQIEGLSLVDEDVVNESIEVSRLIARIEHEAEWEQRELQALLSTLSGETAIARDANPLRPDVYARAFWAAIKSIQVGGETQLALLKGGIHSLALLVKRANAAAVQRLEASGVQPAAYRTVKTPSAAGSGARMADAGHAVGSGAGAAPALAQMLAAMPMPAHHDLTRSGSGIRRTLAASDLPTRPLEQVLRQIEWGLSRDSLPEVAEPGDPEHGLRMSNQLLHQAERLQQRLSPDVDPRVIDLISRLFDQFLSDPFVPATVRGVIGRLQVSVLRVALTDSALLNRTDHPTWQFLDRLASHGAGYAAADHPQWADLLRFAEETIDEITRQQVHDRTLYERADKRLQGFEAALHARWLDTQAATRQQLERAETLERWRGIHRARMITLIQDEPLTDSLRRFLLTTWVDALARATAAGGEHGPQTRLLAEFPQQLLVSLRPLRVEADRSRLVALLPTLLSTLRAGMDHVDWPQARRKPLFDELVSLHAEVLRGGDPLSDAQARSDHTAPLSQFHTTFGDEVPAVDVHALDTVPADLMRTPDDTPRAAPGPWVDALVRGRWYRLFLDGQWTAARYAWRSPRGASLLFEGDAPGLSHALMRRALERLYAEDLAGELETHGLVQRGIHRLQAALA